jgi:hypothetical protein
MHDGLSVPAHPCGAVAASAGAGGLRAGVLANSPKRGVPSKNSFGKLGAVSGVIGKTPHMGFLHAPKVSGNRQPQPARARKRSNLDVRQLPRVLFPAAHSPPRLLRPSVPPFAHLSCQPTLPFLAKVCHLRRAQGGEKPRQRRGIYDLR